MKYSGFPRPRLPHSSAHRRRAAPPPRLLHHLPSLNRVVPQHPSPSHRLRWAGRNVAVGPDGYPLRVDRSRVGLEVKELLLLLGIQPPLTTSLFVKAAVLIRYTDGLPALSEPTRQTSGFLRKLNHVSQRHPLQLGPRWRPPLRQVQIAVGDLSQKGPSTQFER